MSGDHPIKIDLSELENKIEDLQSELAKPDEGIKRYDINWDTSDVSDDGYYEDKEGVFCFYVDVKSQQQELSKAKEEVKALKYKVKSFNVFMKSVENMKDSVEYLKQRKRIMNILATPTEPNGGE